MPDANEIAQYAKLLKLTPIDGDRWGSSPASGMRVAEKRSVRQRFVEKLLSRSWMAILASGLFALAAVVFFAAVAADRYESEARFVIRMPGRTLGNDPLTELLSSGISRTNDDAWIVREYLMSRDAARYLEEKGLLRRAFANANADFIWRFPNFYTPDNEEGLYRHYQRLVSTFYDATSGVSVLRVQAFSPEEAKEIATVLLQAGEGLVNRLNESAKQDAIMNAEREVERLKARVFAAQKSLTAFRTREALIDPTQASLVALEAISTLSLEVVQVKLQIADLQHNSPQAPQGAALKIRLQTLEDEILTQRRRLAGDATSIAPKIAEYERLSLEREFAERALVGAMSAVEMARLDAERQQVYLERISAPNLSDHPSYPYRILWCVVAIVAWLAAARLLAILVADTRKHAEA